MTHHGETTGSSNNDDIAGRKGSNRPAARSAHPTPTTPVQHLAPSAYGGDLSAQQVTLRTPAELADALPYLLGYRPEDSIVLVCLHDRDGRGRFGGRARLGIPANPDDWPSVARQLAQGLVKGSERRGARPEQMVAYVCQEPSAGETGQQVMERLRPLVQQLRVECGLLDVPVIDALCISDGRFWSYCCDIKGCCPAGGTPMGLPGTSVLAAAATYAGLQVRGTLRELRARLIPWETAAVPDQEAALDTASLTVVRRILDETSRAQVAEETLELAERLMGRLAAAPPAESTAPADLRDDELLTHDEAATLILGLQDRTTRDRAAEWMEGDDAAPAIRLWRALARRCVGSYGEHAAAPLTLVGWVAWSTGDDIEAREALAMALGADPDYLFARLLHQAVNEGLDPESLRRCLRAEREERAQDDEAGPDGSRNGSSTSSGFDSGADRGTDDAPPSGSVARPAPAPVPAASTTLRRRTRPGTPASGTSVARPLPKPSGSTRPGDGRPGRTRPGDGRPSGARPGALGEETARRRGSRTGDGRPAASGGTEEDA
ncbi:DUF4192 domain-containing protein [Streptomyces flavalbus]|uniref:DUF4192 family protein n=1 Tax=Streptomyces flavalbus TaxID=2665155 RepID=A0ABW2WDW5_9ACTN